jgi:membrane protein DedA with SNARE-associated domain
VADDLIEFVSRADGWTLGLVVFLLVLAESLIVTDIVAPGEVGLVVAGAAAARNGTSLGVVVGAAAFGAVVGDTAGYLLGRTIGTDLIETRHWLRRLRPALRRARHAFDRRGPIIVAMARWVGALRAVVPLVAGSARLAAPPFLLADWPSAVLWSLVMSSLGFVWGDDIAGAIDKIGLGVSITVVALLVIVLLVRWRRRTREGDP